jgi:hypothetical protein
MRLTDFWQRLEGALGVGYARSWASDYVIADLGGRTVMQSIDDGIDTVAIWRAVHAELKLPASER